MHDVGAKAAPRNRDVVLELEHSHASRWLAMTVRLFENEVMPPPHLAPQNAPVMPTDRASINS